MLSRNRSGGPRPRRIGPAIASVILASALFLASGDALALEAAQERGAAEVELMQRFEAAMPLLAMADEHLAAGDLARAEKQLTDLVARVPELSEAHFLLAKARYTQKRFAAALTSIEKAKATLDSTASLIAKVRERRKSELLEERSRQLAVISTEESRRSSAGETDSGVKTGSAQQSLGVIERELSDIAAADTMEMRAEYPFVHGNILLRLGRNAEAVDQYEAALAIDPAYGAAANNLASVYYSAKRYERAREIIERIEAHGASVQPELKKAVLAALGQ